MKKTIFLLLTAATCMMTSCLTSGLDELEAFDEAEITDIYFEHRYVMKVGATGVDVVNFQRLTVVEKVVDSENATIRVTVNIPPANATFPEVERGNVSMNNLAAYCYLSTAASIAPVDGAPRLGTLGDYSAPVRYKVTAADGKTSKIWTITAGFPPPVEVPRAVGTWLFDDADNLLAASVGQNLIPSGEGFTAIAGPSASNGAVRVAQGSYFRALHGIAANGGGNRVNDYTLMVDFRVSELGRYYCFEQTTLENSDDGDFFLRPAGNLGIGGTGYSEYVASTGEWHRLVISASMGNAYNYYIDGALIHQGNTDAASVDSRFSWLPEGVLLFADEDGEDAEIDIAEVSVWGIPLSEVQIDALGGVK